MREYQSINLGSQIPLKTKILLGLGIILILSLLFFFAFAFFLITLVSGFVLYVFNLFQGTKTNLNPNVKSPPPRPTPYRPTHRNDDDIIDI